MLLTFLGGLLGILCLSGCYSFSAPQLEEDWKKFSPIEHQPPCSDLLSLKQHSSYTMHLLGKCFESGWDNQGPVPAKAIEAHTRAARCGDPQSLSWLQQQADFNKMKKDWKFYIAKQTRVEDHFEIEGLLDSAGYSCNLKRHYTFYWYILQPIGFTIQVAFLPLCLFSNSGCPLLESSPSYPNYQPPPYLMGEFDRSLLYGFQSLATSPN